MGDDFPPRQERIAVEGCELWTESQGNGPRGLALIHGGPGLWDWLKPVADMVDDLCRVHRFDQRGCGRSSGEGPYSLDGALADLEALRLAWGHEKWVVGGHSYGADLSLIYALRHPESVTGIVYISGTGPTADWRSAYAVAKLSRLRPQARSRLEELDAIPSTIRDADEKVRREYLRLHWSDDLADPEQIHLLDSIDLDGLFVNLEANRALAGENRRLQESGDLVRQLPDLSVPVLIIHGALDPRPVAAAEAVANLVPNARLVVLKGAGHIPWLEQNTEMRSVVRDFIQSLN
ncbi:MAG: alpha/beta fold hydrolase [Candidatus Dormibacteria bacterium]